MKRKVREGNSHCDFMHELICISADAPITVYFWVENPDTSWFWRQKLFIDYRQADSEHIFRCCFCRFGTPWKKPTRFATNIKPLCGLRLNCVCKQPRTQLRGRSPLGKAWTLVAEHYPRRLRELLAKAVCAAASWIRSSRLDVAGCARAGSLRIGEASKPGPRRRSTRHGQDLEGIQLRTTTTLARESQALEAFLSWVGRFIVSIDPEQLFPLAPEFLVAALCSYGRHSWGAGGTLSSYRHLVLCCQRWVPLCRALTQPCWELVSKWEIVEPVCHRTPVPEGLLKALVVTAWQLRWFSWVGVTLIAFYGAGRVGEVLRCYRSDLICPSDVLDRDHSGIFLQLRQFKALGRQPSKIQHMEIQDANAIRLICCVFEHFPKDMLLYAASPSAYRRRWDYLLQLCGIPLELRITPGGLRGGAAVMMYRKHTPIHDILWRLRLRSQSTLESYLQETAASAIFVSLDPSVRNRLFNIGALFELLGIS